MVLPLGDSKGDSGAAEDNIRDSKDSTAHAAQGFQSSTPSFRGRGRAHNYTPGVRFSHTNILSSKPFSPDPPTFRYVQTFVKFSRPAISRSVETFPTCMGTDHTQLLSKGAVHYAYSTPSQEQGFLCSLFVVPKMGGGHRPVINLKHLKGFVPYEHFKMESIHMLNRLHSHAEGSSKKRGLYGKNRPEGCIPDSTGLEAPPEIPSVFVEGFPAIGCLSTLRLSQCSTGIHQTTETSTVNAKAEGNSPHCVSRRYPPYGSFKTTSPSACCIYSESPRRTQAHGELFKVCSRIFPTNGVFRVPGGFSKSKSKPPQRQNKKDSVKPPTTVRQPSNFSK